MGWDGMGWDGMGWDGMVAALRGLEIILLPVCVPIGNCGCGCQSAGRDGCQCYEDSSEDVQYFRAEC